MRFLWPVWLLLGWFFHISEPVAGDDKGVPLSPVSERSLTFRGVDLAYLLPKEDEGDEDNDDRGRTKRHQSVSLIRNNLTLSQRKDSVAKFFLEDSVRNDLVDVSLDDEVPVNDVRVKDAPANDIPIAFFEKTDLLLESKLSPRMASCQRWWGIIGSPLGLIAIPGFVGVIRQLSRDMLDAPKGSFAGEVMVWITSIGLILPYMGKTKLLLEELLTCSKGCCSPTRKREETSKEQEEASREPEEVFVRQEKAEREFMLPVSGWHTLSKVSGGLVNMSDTAFMVAYMVYAELRDVEPSARTEAMNYVGVIAAVYGTLTFATNWNNLQQELNRFFYKKKDTRETSLKRELLITRLRVMKEWLKHAPENEIQRRYRVITGSEVLEKKAQPWILSWFIAERVEDAKAAGARDVKWTNFAADLEVFNYTLPRRKTADGLTKVLMTLGTVGRVETFHLASNLVLINGLGIKPEMADIFSYVLAGVVAGGKAFWESHLHHGLVRKIFRCDEINASPDGMGALIPAVGSAGISAGLTALGMYALGLQAFGESYPSGARSIFLICAAFLDFSAYFASFKKSTLAIVRPIARVCLSKPEKIRQDLIKRCNKLEAMVERFKPHTIKKLYKWLSPQET